MQRTTYKCIIIGEPLIEYIHISFNVQFKLSLRLDAYSGFNAYKFVIIF